MKFSEAIRMGSQWADCYGPVRAGDCYCLIGGVLKSSGFEHLISDGGHGWGGSQKEDREFYEMFPIVNRVVKYPGQKPRNPWLLDEIGNCKLMAACISLYESDRWTKKAIAEWVEVIENKQEAARVDGNNAAPVGAVEAPASVDSPASVQSVNV